MVDMKAVALLLFAVALTAGCIGQTSDLANTDTVTIETAGGPVDVDVEVADSLSERAQGLMNIVSLDENRGMLFVFDNGDKVRSFWMKDTLIPLDIFYISSDSVIVDIQTMEPCTADPCPSYPSKAPAANALEVNAGFAAENGISAGDMIRYR